MKIGIDIDNCISDFDDTLLKEYLKHDKELRNTGIIQRHKHRYYYKWYSLPVCEGSISTGICVKTWYGISASEKID